MSSTALASIRNDPATREYESRNHRRQASRAATRSHENGHAAAPSQGCDRHAPRPSRPEGELTTECRARHNRHRRWPLTPATKVQGVDRLVCARRLGIGSAQVPVAAVGGRRRLAPSGSREHHPQAQRRSGENAWGEGRARLFGARRCCVPSERAPLLLDDLHAARPAPSCDVHPERGATRLAHVKMLD